MDDVKVKTPYVELNKRTAILYVSAAFLVFAVGARMLNTIWADTESFGLFEWIMIVSIVLEVVMLVYYAELVRRIPEDGGSSSATGGPVTVQMGHNLSGAFQHVRESIDQLTKELKDTRSASKANIEIASSFQKTEEHMAGLLQQIVDLREEIAEMSRDRLKDNIRSEVREVLTNFAIEAHAKKPRTAVTTTVKKTKTKKSSR